MQSGVGALWGPLSSPGFKADEIATSLGFFWQHPHLPEAAGVLGGWSEDGWGHGHHLCTQQSPCVQGKAKTQSSELPEHPQSAKSFPE